MMASMGRRIWLALSFGTVLPVPRLRAVDKQELQRSVGFFPLVGLLLGATLWASVWLLGRDLPRWPVALLALTLYAVLTGGLHLDGLMDTMDAVGSRKPPREALDIMKDSHVGAMGTLAAILLLLGKASAFASLSSRHPGVWIAVPMMARMAVVWSMVLAPPARPSGLGALYARQISWRTVTLATLLGVGGAFWLVSWQSAALLTVLAVTVTWGWTGFVGRRFGGSTGDTFGALVEIMEWAGFLAMVGVWAHGG